MKLISLNIGKKKTYDFDGKIIETALVKEPTSENIYVHKLGLTGDEQAEKIIHGGVDKAVCFYPFEHYEYFNNHLNKKFPVSSFGENISLKGLVETDISIGDILQIGEVILQITQPRQPCFKLNYIHNISNMAHLSQNLGYTGYYARVLEEGNINIKDNIIILKKHPKNISVDFTNKILHNDNKNLEAIKKILEVDELAVSLKRTFERLLSSEIIDPKPRLEG